MKYIIGVVIIGLLGTLFVVGFNSYTSNEFDNRMDEIINADNYTLKVFYMTDSLDGEDHLERTITIQRNRDSYSVVNSTGNYHYTSFLVPNEDQYEVYLKTSNQGEHAKILFPNEPNRYLNTIDFNIQDLNSSMFNYRSGEYRLDSEALPSVFEDNVGSLTVTIEKDLIIFDLELSSEGSIQYHFKDIGRTDPAIPDLSNAPNYEPYSTSRSFTETETPYVSAISDFGIMDNTHIIEVDIEGQYLIWVESDLYLQGQIWSDQQSMGNVIEERGPDYNFLISAELKPGISYNLMVTEYTSLFHGPYDVYVVLVDEEK